MEIGIPKETKTHEYRISLTPAGVVELCNLGHRVYVATQAGEGVGFSDQQYRDAGARIVDQAQALGADMVVKVKEPSLSEAAQLQAGQLLFTYLHLAAEPALARALLKSKVTAIGYETVEDAQGRLPLLAPMSEVAGRLSVQVGAHALQKASGGRGTLLGGVPGVAPGKVVILGGGMAGVNAARMAVGLQADVTILDISVDRLRELSAEFAGRATVLMASKDNLCSVVRSADLVIGAVLVPGARAPCLLDRPLLRQMHRGAVLVDIAIDQGGCFATSRPTTHDAPTFIEEGIVHYCVTNMPGAVARTATEALSNVTLPYVQMLAEHGWRQAFRQDPGFARGLNTHNGRVCHAKVAAALGVEHQLAA